MKRKYTASLTVFILGNGTSVRKEDSAGHSRSRMVKQSIVYTLDELRPIRASVDQCRSSLIKFIEQYKSLDILSVESRLLNRCVYKNWNARRAELGIQASRRTSRLLERFLGQRQDRLHDILKEFQPNEVEIRLPSRGTLNQLLTRLEESTSILKQVQRRSKTTVDRLRLECSRANYVQYNLLIMSLCSRIYFLSLALVQAQEEFCAHLKKSLKSFKKKSKD
jgi:hypothetical protein